MKDWLILWKRLRRIKPDLIISTDYIISALLVFCRIAGLKSKIIGWEHMTLRDPGMNIFFKRVRNRIYKGLHALIVLTNDDDSEVKKIGVYCRCIPNAVSFSSVTKSSLEQKQILTIARFSQQKGIDILLRIVEKLGEKLDGWKFVLVGIQENITRAWLNEQIGNYGIEEYIEVREPKTEVTEFYLSSSIYLMTSRYEGLPMVLLEAMECGLPCISFNCPTGPSDIIIDGVNGYLVDCFDIQEIIDRLVKLMDSRELRMQFASNAFLSLENFTRSTIRDKWLNFFDELLND